MALVFKRWYGFHTTWLSTHTNHSPSPTPANCLVLDEFFKITMEKIIFPPKDKRSMSKIAAIQFLHDFFFHKFIYLFIYFYFWLHWVFVAVRGLSLVVARGGYSSLRWAGFSLWWLLLLQSRGSRCVGFSSCGTWAQKLWRTGLVAPRHMGSSRTRARTRVPCIGRRILNHCATREVPIA